MDAELAINLLAFVFFLILSAFFSSSETAFTAISQFRLESMVEKGVAGAERLRDLLNDRRRLLTCVLIGNNIANIVASAMATTFITNLLDSLNINNFGLGLVIVTTVMTFLILTFGEITPKTMAIRQAENWGLMVSRPIQFFMVAFYPLVGMFNFISGSISKLFGIDYNRAKKLLTEEEIKSMIKLGNDVGILAADKRDMIHSIFDFSDTVVREIMTPRPDCICISVDQTISEAINLIIDQGHSRIPVFEDRIDNILGVIYAKDLLGLESSSGTTSLRKFMREPIFMPETKKIEDLLQQMKKQKFQMAIVVDEYGGFSGIATFEDIIEEIIGEIQDEYEEDENPEFIDHGKDHYTADAGMNIDTLSEKLDVKFPDDEEFDTLAGLIIHLFGRFPKKGETIEFEALRFKVKEVNKRRILNVEITRIE